MAKAKPSIGQTRRALPDEFVEDLYAQFGTTLAERTMQGFAAGRKTTLRANSLKISGDSLAERLHREGIAFDRTAWYAEAFILRDTRQKQIEKLDLYEQGALYLQSLSSMLPPLALSPRPGEAVLDVAAAPGSKTTQMAALMENRGRIVAIEVDPRRAETLRFNVDRQGAEIVEVHLGRGEKVGQSFTQSFDRVLLDAPCSGEGLFQTTSGRTWRHWSRKLVGKCARLQRKLLESAWQTLKPGGTLVYSTCTLNRAENEEVLAWAATELRAEFLPIEIVVPGMFQARARKGDIPELAAARRLLPSAEFEGFFLARLRKS